MAGAGSGVAGAAGAAGVGSEVEGAAGAGSGVAGVAGVESAVVEVLVSAPELESLPAPARAAIKSAAASEPEVPEAVLGVQEPPEQVPEVPVLGVQVPPEQVPAVPVLGVLEPPELVPASPIYEVSKRPPPFKRAMKSSADIPPSLESEIGSGSGSGSFQIPDLTRLPSGAIKP